MAFYLIGLVFVKYNVCLVFQVKDYVFFQTDTQLTLAVYCLVSYFNDIYSTFRQYFIGLVWSTDKC